MTKRSDDQGEGKHHPHPVPASPLAPGGSRAPNFTADAGYRAKLLAELETAAGLGVPMDTIAAFAGIAPRTLRDYMAKGRAGIQPYVELYERVIAARARNEVRVLGVQYRVASLPTEIVEEEVKPDGTRITRRLPADPGVLSAVQRASAWILEHVHGYYRTERHVLEPSLGAGGAPRTDEEVQAYLDRVQERIAQQGAQREPDPSAGG
jgi:hypothetical protein